MAKNLEEKPFPSGIFYIVPEVNENFALDAEGEGKTPNTKVILWVFRSQKNQQFEFSKDSQKHNDGFEYGYVKNVMNGLVMEIKSGISLQNKENGKDTQLWRLAGKCLINKSVNTEKQSLFLTAKNEKGSKLAASKMDENNFESHEFKLISLEALDVLEQEEVEEGKSANFYESDEYSDVDEEHL